VPATTSAGNATHIPRWLVTVNLPLVKYRALSLRHAYLQYA